MEKIRFSIRTKLFLLVLVAFTTLIVTTSWQIGLQANKTATKSIEQSLEQSSVILDTKIDSRFTSIKDTASSLARDGRILPLVYEGESLTLQDLSLEFERVLEFDSLFFLDAEGTVLARSDRPEAIGRNMSGKSPLFDNPLNGSHEQGFIVSQGKLLQIVVVPIVDNVAADVVRGAVALAYELSGQIAQEINTLTASDIAFFIFTRDQQREIAGVKNTHSTNPVLGQKLDSYFVDEGDLWKPLYDAKSSDFDVQLTIDGEDFFSVVQRFENTRGNPLGYVMALRSRTELLQPFLDIQRRVLIIGFICLLVASVFAWFFSQRISRPIIELVSLAKNVQEGRFQDKSKNKKGHDEIATLYNAMVTMGNRLKEKAELESYLAHMSDELDIEENILIDVEHENEFVADDGEETHAISGLPKDELSRKPDNMSGDKTVINTSQTKEAVTSSIAPDQRIDDRYQIIRQIGSGAMGKVFLAQDIELDERVAIKVMTKELFSQQESINFKEEIRLARRITHRNILRTFDFGSWKEYYYITMEYVSGYDLGMLLKNKGAFDVHIGLVMARQICSAMNAAHEQGIIHRDLKPSNMMINRQGILKIMDFGLAMKVDTQRKSRLADEDKDTTTIAGTPRYMAPEQFFNWPLDERTDIYAIGIILYAIFSGAPPFTKGDITELATMHLKKKAMPIGDKKVGFPPELQTVIDKALQKKPEDRFQAVGELLDELNTLT